MVYENCKIYGAYERKDGRKHICVIWPDGKRSTVSYPKYLMEKHLNRYLTKDETVDHIDRDFTNNNIDNLQILDRLEHIKIDAKRVKEQEFVCRNCGKVFVRKPTPSLNKRNTGYFCSKRCVGLYGKKIQLGEEESEYIESIEREYYYLDK